MLLGLAGPWLGVCRRTWILECLPGKAHGKVGWHLAVEGLPGRNDSCWLNTECIFRVSLEGQAQGVNPQT